mgnify:CR=1 FL=1
MSCQSIVCGHSWRSPETQPFNNYTSKFLSHTPCGNILLIYQPHVELPPPYKDCPESAFYPNSNAIVRSWSHTSSHKASHFVNAFASLKTLRHTDCWNSKDWAECDVLFPLSTEFIVFHRHVLMQRARCLKGLKWRILLPLRRRCHLHVHVTKYMVLTRMFCWMIWTLANGRHSWEIFYKRNTRAVDTAINPSFSRTVVPEDNANSSPLSNFNFWFSDSK